MKKKEKKEYKSELVAAYNGFIAYVAQFFRTFDEANRIKVKDKVNTSKANVLRSLIALDLTTDLPEDFKTINIYDIVSNGENLDDSQTGSSIFLSRKDVNTEANVTYDDLDPQSSNPAQKTSDSNETPNGLASNSNFNSNTDTPLNNSLSNIATMPQTFIEFLNIATKLINYKYDGDPLSLNTFLNKVELLETATEDGNIPHLVKYVKSCLEGKALEAIPHNAATLRALTDALRGEIKFESSKVIEGKLMALKADHNKLNDYAKKAEELALAFKRSLVLEEFPPRKANEMAVAKTIELCRANCRSAMVRGILGASKFENAEEVIAKYIIESRTETTENQILAFQKQNVRNRDNSRGGYQNGNNRGGYQNNYNKNGNYGNQSRGRGNYNNNYRGNHYNNNYRGRGRGRRDDGRRDDRNVRVMGNQEAPPPGAPQNVQANQAEN